jgi:hypothetical protein
VLVILIIEPKAIPWYRRIVLYGSIGLPQAKFTNALSGIKPLTITKRQGKELLPPKLVDRLIYAAKNFPEIGWSERFYRKRRVKRFGKR